MRGPTTILIGGSMRSGTTLLNRILCAAPGVNPMLGECQYISGLLDQHAYLARRHAVLLKDYFDSPAAYDAHMRGLVADFLDRAAARHPAPTLVLKTPEITRHIPTLADWFPDLRFVVMMRDPRDVIASILDVADRHRAAGSASPLLAYGRDMRRLADLVLSYYAPLAEAGERLIGRVFVQRYEALVSDPAAALPPLAAFTGLALEPAHLAAVPEAMRAAGLQAVQRDGFVRGFVTPLMSEAPSATQVGRHRTRLAAAEIAAIEARCAGLNRLAAYW